MGSWFAMETIKECSSPHSNSPPFWSDPSYASADVYNCDEKAVQMSKIGKKRRASIESRDDAGDLNNGPEDQTSGTQRIPADDDVFACSDILPSSKLSSETWERISHAKAKAALLLAALGGGKLSERRKKGSKRSKKKKGQSLLLHDFVPSKLSPIIECTESMVSNAGVIEDKEKLNADGTKSDVSKEESKHEILNEESFIGDGTLDAITSEPPDQDTRSEIGHQPLPGHSDDDVTLHTICSCDIDYTVKIADYKLSDNMHETEILLMEKSRHQENHLHEGNTSRSTFMSTE